jgi:fatty acid desaturase
MRTTEREARYVTPQDRTTEHDLDGSTGVLLAPARGPEIRRNLNPALFVKHPGRFIVKYAFALVLIAASWVFVALYPGVLSIITSILVNGLMYAHLVELQHECLHEHAFLSRGLNRLFGFVAGLPMLSSYSHYKYEHLRHHAFLGTPQNQEFFNYQFHNLDSPIGFLRGAYHLGRYGSVSRDIGRSLIGRTNPRVTKPKSARRIRTEYLLFTAVIASAVAWTVLTGSPYLLWVWVAPLLLVSEPAHFLIEMPEHYGLNTQTDANVLSNTRSVAASMIGHWFTNGNDLHTAHHFHQGVPMVNVPRLHCIIENSIETFDPSYPSFYRRVINGQIRFQGDDKTCMTPMSAHRSARPQEERPR